jgi:hypothetical protein
VKESNKENFFSASNPFVILCPMQITASSAIFYNIFAEDLPFAAQSGSPLNGLAPLAYAGEARFG